MGLSVSDKLKKYITENGGDPSGAQTIAELVDKLPAVGSGGGGGGGDTPAAESNIFLLHSPSIYINHPGEGESLTFEESADDIADAMNAGKAVMVMDRNSGVLFNNTGYTFSDGRPDELVSYEGSFQFTKVSTNEMTYYYIYLWTDPDTGELSSEFYKYKFTLTPKT